MRYFVGAEIHMKPEESGGRHCEFTAGWCPDLNIGLSYNIAVRVVEVITTDQSGRVLPGEDAEVIVSLFPTAAVIRDPPLGYNELAVGGTFEILEGWTRVVGTGKILLKWTEP